MDSVEMSSDEEMYEEEQSDIQKQSDVEGEVESDDTRYTLSTWPTHHVKAKRSLRHAGHRGCTLHVPAVSDEHKELISPLGYEEHLKGALVMVNFVVHHFAIDH